MAERFLLERSRLLVLTGGSTTDQSHECLFQGGRRTAQDGTTERFGGSAALPLIRSGPSLEAVAPPPSIDRHRAQLALERLTSALGRPFRVQLCIRSWSRLAGGGEPKPGTSAGIRWWLTGQIEATPGRDLPVGRSGNQAGLEEDAWELLVEDLCRQISALQVAHAVTSGPSAALLRPQAAAVLLHEAVGHFVEAVPGVDLHHRLGVRLASEAMHVEDDPQAGGAASYYCDDEGVFTRGATRVVREGRVVGLLHSLDTAQHASALPTANGRAAAPWDTPLPRMSNLLCSPGEASEEGMIDRLGNGLRLHALSYGFSFGSTVEARMLLAEIIRNGKATGRYLTGGRILETRDLFCRAVELGRHSQFSPNALCGKRGQMLCDVGTQVPAVRLRSLRIAA